MIEWIGYEIRQFRPQEAFWVITAAEDQDQLSISQYASIILRLFARLQNNVYIETGAENLVILFGLCSEPRVIIGKR